MPPLREFEVHFSKGVFDQRFGVDKPVWPASIARSPMPMINGSRKCPVRAERRRPDLLDNEAEAVALVEPMDEAIIAKKIL
jgi:hypothetical protein